MSGIISTSAEEPLITDVCADAATYLKLILVGQHAANSFCQVFHGVLVRCPWVFPQHATLIEYKAMLFKEIALITGWSPGSVSRLVL